MSEYGQNKLAFGEGNLVGDAWMRVVYLDESGIGNIKQDRVLVVAGILIHADTQWGVIGNRLSELLDDATPMGVKRPRFLHAKDIFHGSKEFNRKQWPEEVRQKLLIDLSDILIEFDLPVIWSAIDRKETFKDDPDRYEISHTRSCYETCVLSCLFQAESYMRELENSAEVASVILEENREIQQTMPELMDFARNAKDGIGLVDHWRDYIPFQKIIDNPSAQPKSASSILQLADYCAFAIKRAMQNPPGRLALGKDFFEQFLLIRNSDPNSDKSLWNPKFMPSAWDNHKLVFRNGEAEFVKQPSSSV